MSSPFSIEIVQTSRDQRGWVSNLLDFLPLPPAELHNIHLVEMQPGSIRGNHRHARQTEWIVVCGGPCRIVLHTGDQKHEQVFLGPEPTMLTIRPGTAHAVKNESEHEVYLLCLTDQPYDFERPDVEKLLLIEE